MGDHCQPIQKSRTDLSFFGCIPGSFEDFPGSPWNNLDEKNFQAKLVMVIDEVFRTLGRHGAQDRLDTGTKVNSSVLDAYA